MTSDTITLLWSVAAGFRKSAASATLHSGSSSGLVRKLAFEPTERDRERERARPAVPPSRVQERVLLALSLAASRAASLLSLAASRGVFRAD